MELSSIKHNMISPQGGKCNVPIVQDSMLGSYRMTRGNQILTKAQFYQIATFFESDFVLKKIQHIRRTLKNMGKKATAFNGKGAFSLLLPNDFQYEVKNDADETEPVVKIKNGVLYEGAINKVNLGKGHDCITLLLNKEYGVETASSFIDHVQYLTNNWLLLSGFSVGITDCMATKQGDIEDVIEKCYIEADEIEKITQHPGIREMRVLGALNKARDVGMKLAKDGLSDDNTFKSTCISGSKGDFFNIAQITGLLGQQNLYGKRIPLMLNQGKRTLSAYPLNTELSRELKYESRGFIKHSFIHGLNPREFYFHAMTGRSGICDTAVGTAKSGYIQRRIVKLLEDVQVRYDGTVRNTVGTVYQLNYGFDPSKQVKGTFCDVDRLVNKLNTREDTEREMKK